MRDGSPLEIAFVGSPVCDAFCEQSPACSVAGNKFQKRLIEAIEAAAGQPLKVVSFVPASMFPRGRQLWYGANTHRLDGNGFETTFVSFVNAPVVKQVSQAWGIFREVAGWLWRKRHARRVVIVYNVFSPHSLPVLAATRLFGGKAVALIADLPHDVYGFRGVKGVLERADFVVQTRSIARFDAQIPLTAAIAEDFAPRVPALVLEGGVAVPANGTEADRPSAAQRDGEDRICMFSGLLNEINGVDLLLDAFARIPGAEYRLWIYGRGPLEARVREAAERDRRIRYGGFLPNAEIARLQRQATVLVNPRPSHRAITRYTFPSKLIEYMLSGRPVLTTALPGIPQEYHLHLHLVRDETPDGLATAIRGVCEMPANERERLAQRTRDFVVREKNWQRQGQRVYDFVREL